MSAPDPNPYAPPTSPLRAGRRVVPATDPPPRGAAFSVRHDLIDDDLKRFYGLDFWYDPVPLLGFIPQWAFVLALVFALGFAGIKLQGKSEQLAMSAGAVGLLVTGGLSIVRTRALRKAAREGGFLAGRQVSISDAGVEVSYPRPPDQDQANVAARDILQQQAISRHASLQQTGIVPARYPWSKFRRVEFLDDLMILWMAGRSRLVLPGRTFHSPGEAEAFALAAAGWIAAA